MFKGKYSKILILACASVLVAGMFALSACGGSSASSKSSSSASSNGYSLVKDGTLTVATSPDYAPMEYQQNGEIKGYDIAIVKEVAKRLNLKVDVQNQSFDSLVAQVAGGTKFDCSISSITINEERSEQVKFSDPYYDSNLAIVVLSSSEATSKDQLNGKPVGAQSGSSGEEWAKENLKNSEYTPFQETPDMLAALRTGKIQAAIYDEPVAENHVKTEYSDCKVLEIIPTGEQYGIIVNKDNAALADAINAALKDMKADGTLDKLKTEAFSATIK